MGLRKKLKNFIKQLLVRNSEPAAPAPNTAENTPPSSEASAQPEAPKSSSATTEPDTTPLPPPAAPIQKPLPAVEPNEVATQDSSLVEESLPEITSAAPLSPTVTSREQTQWESDYLTEDAPTRTAHHREAYEATNEAYQIEVQNPETNETLHFPCEPEEFILDAADRAGIELPYSCRSGGCLSCSAKIISGSVDMAEQYVLEEEEVDKGFLLLCCTSPTSNAVLLSHQEDNINI